MPRGIYQHKKGYKRPPISDEWRANLSASHIGQVAWNRGTKGYLAGEAHWKWQGDKPSYRAAHGWIYQQLGKAVRCTYDPSHEAKRYEWANISGSYRRDIDDYVSLCSTCHHQYDRLRAGKYVRIEGGQISFV